MEKIWIFGDSYAAPYLDSPTWTTQLSNEYSVKNFAEPGQGPDFALDRFLNEKNNTSNLSEIIIIFLISSIHRFNFKNINPLFIHFFENNKLEQVKGNDNSNPVKDVKFIKRFLDEYVYHSTYNKTEILKIIGFLNLHSTFFKKMLVWPIFERPKIDCSTSENFFVPNFNLGLLTSGTWFSEKNHLPQHLHDLLNLNINNWIRNNEKFHLNNFLSNN